MLHIKPLVAIVGAHVLESTMGELRAKGIEIRGEPHDAGFGITTTMVLPGDVEVLPYQPKHASPL